MADRYGYGDYTSPAGRRDLNRVAPAGRIDQAMPGWRVNDPAARGMGFEGAGIDPNYPAVRLRDMNLGADPPSYGVDTDTRGWTYQRRAEAPNFGGGPLSPAEQEAMARQFERMYGDNQLTPNQRVNRAHNEAARGVRASRAIKRVRPDDPALRNMKRYQLNDLDYYGGLSPKQQNRRERMAAQMARAERAGRTVAGAKGAYGRRGSGGRVNIDPYQGDRVDRQPTPTGQVTWARDPLTGAYGPRQVLGNARDEAMYADWKTGGRADSSFSTGVGAGSWR